MNEPVTSLPPAALLAITLAGRYRHGPHYHHNGFLQHVFATSPRLGAMMVAPILVVGGPEDNFYGSGYCKQKGMTMSVGLDEQTRELLDGRNFATVATLNADGGPHTSVVWIARGDGDTVLFSTTAGRQKTRNLARDPRISLTIIDAENPYHSVDIRGTAELIEDRDKSLPRRLSQKYLGEDPPAEPDEMLRLIVRVTPQKVTGFSL